MDALRSAFRHGVDLEDPQPAVRNAMVVEEIATDPTRYLVLGPDRAGNLLLRATEEHISVSEAIRRAIGQYLRAS